MIQMGRLMAEVSSGPAGAMDQSSTLMLRLLSLSVFLLVSTNIICLHGNPTAGDHGLHCVNDYLFTINCTMSIAPSESTSDGGSSYWLNFTQTYEQGPFVCLLTNTDGNYSCSVDTSDPLSDYDHYAEIFSDSDAFEVSLCEKRNNGSEICKVLDMYEYTPFTNIKPRAPCCLTISHNLSEHHFTWKSTYEEYSPYTDLVDSFKYHLNFFKRGDRHMVTSRDIYTDGTNHSVGDHIFIPDTEYTARVRSSPNQAFYKGQWSDWSSEVHWKTESAINDLASNTFDPELVKKVLISTCVMVPFILLLCYAPIKKWRQSAFIPTPAPYFQTLYSDCQGDFKSWVITQENTADMVRTEQSLKIDTLTKCTDNPGDDGQPKFHYQPMKGSAYSNLSPVSDIPLLGIPYAVTTLDPRSAPGGLTLSSEPGIPADGDMGYWLSSYMSLERDSPWYCNEYCTVSTFKQSTAGPCQLNLRDYQSGRNWGDIK